MNQSDQQQARLDALIDELSVVEGWTPTCLQFIADTFKSMTGHELTRVESLFRERLAWARTARRCSNCVMFYPEDGCVDAVSFKMPSGEFRAPGPNDCCGSHELRKPVFRLIASGGFFRKKTLPGGSEQSSPRYIPTKNPT